MCGKEEDMGWGGEWEESLPGREGRENKAHSVLRGEAEGEKRG